MEPLHGSHACRFGTVVDKCAITFGDEEQTLDVVCCFAREVLFEGDDGGVRGQVTHPKRIAGLSGLPRRTPRIRRGSLGGNVTSSETCGDTLVV